MNKMAVVLAVLDSDSLLLKDSNGEKIPLKDRTGKVRSMYDIFQSRK